MSANLSPVAIRTEVYETKTMKGSEFLRRVKVLSKRKAVVVQWNAERGSGSHGTLYPGSWFTIVKDLTKEIGPGLLSAMCRQLGIRKEEL